MLEMLITDPLSSNDKYTENPYEREALEVHADAPAEPLLVTHLLVHIQAA